ncbi:DNA topoisomerase I, partial [bacterium]|nr:DNA topoisomerase I [bacterium]
VQLGEHEEEKPKRMALPAGVEPEAVTMPMALNLLSLPKTLGEHPESGKEVKKGLGRFGPYVVHDGDFRSIPKTDDIFEVELPRALELLAQPKKGRGRAAPLKEFGDHPETGDPIQLLTGKYGPYIKCGKTNVSIPEDQEPKDVTLEQALELLKDRLKTGGKKKKAQKKASASGAKKATLKKKASSKKATAKKSASKKASATKKVIRRKAGGKN